MNPQKYVEALVRKNGLQAAWKIAAKSKENSAPASWASLPVGNIFYSDIEGHTKLNAEEKSWVRSLKSKDTEGKYYDKQYALDVKGRKATFNFWSNVEGILNRMIEGRKNRAAGRKNKKRKIGS